MRIQEQGCRGETADATPDAQRILVPRAQLNPACGCAAKLGGAELSRMVAGAFAENSVADRSPAATPEDCAVFEPICGQLLASVDFGPLVCSDANRAGRIAATHALSDIWASGGVPVGALALVVVDPALAEGVPRAVLSGMLAVCLSEGITLAGGHTILGAEALAGLAVMGRAGERLLSKGDARPGQQLLISKPLGFGLALRAHRNGLIDDEQVEVVYREMERSNRAASLAAADAGVLAGTDVTGYGLLGHLAEMLAPTGLGADVELAAVPVLPVVRELAPGALHSHWITDNAAYCRERITVRGGRELRVIAPLVDPQTSGGLLVAADPDRTGHLIDAGFTRIGEVTNTNRLEIRT